MASPTLIEDFVAEELKNNFRHSMQIGYEI